MLRMNVVMCELLLRAYSEVPVCVRCRSSVLVMVYRNSYACLFYGISKGYYVYEHVT